ncbi:MAG: diaminopimelate epimerase [Candidatus Rokubacteria bacterium]|nr:diaminopimelate epimerase [Candidatus Rokubacteria bacterium]
MIPFVKGHGLGNDYLVLDGKDLDFPLTPLAVQRLCHRNWGIGSDGILLLVESPNADFGLRIFNPDGSEAEKSGNGLRIFAKYLFEHGRARGPRFSVETVGGVVECQCHLAGGRVSSVTVEMGRVTFRAPDIPMNGPDREVVGVPLQVNDQLIKVSALSVGNPHCVVFTDRLDADEVRRLGPQIERHPAFPKRTNVQFAKVESPDRVAILIWERGAGFTLASGSSACAVASAAVRNGLCEHGQVTVVMPGGELIVDVRADWSLCLQGPAEEVCTGTLSSDLVSALKAGIPIR